VRYYAARVIALFVAWPLTAASQATDTVRVGTLAIYASSINSFSGVGKLGPPRVMSDLNTTVSIANTGATPVETVLKPCGVRLRVYSDSTRPRETEKAQFVEGQYGCMADATKVRLNAGQSQTFSGSMQGWGIAGGRKSLGPWYVVVDVHLADTVVSLHAGQVMFDAGLTNIKYRTTTRIEGVAPASLKTQITLYNRGDRVAPIEYGDCPIRLRAFRSQAKRRIPVWRSEGSGPPFLKKTEFFCTMSLHVGRIQPGDSLTLATSVPTYEILADSIPEGRYYFGAELELNWRKIDLDAGSAIVPLKLQAVPSSRTIDGVRFSTSLRRMRFKGSLADSLEFAVTVHNSSKTTRHLRATRASNCASIVGYATRERRNSHYMRSARDDRAGIIITCPVAVPTMTLTPGESRTVLGRAPAPEGQSYYMIFFDLQDDDNPGRREPIWVDLSADETRSAPS